MQLFLIRHAQSQNNALPEDQRVEDPGLTEIGREQAKHLAQWIPSLKLTKLVTSPFLRALETVHPIHQATSLIPEVRAELHEQGGCYRGHTSDNMVGRPGMSRLEIEQAYPGYRVAAEIDGQGWWASKAYETRQAAQERAARLLRRTIDEFAATDERVAYVMHADVTMLLLEHLRFEAFECPCNTSVTTLRITPGECRLEHFNAIHHLPAAFVTR